MDYLYLSLYYVLKFFVWILPDFLLQIFIKFIAKSVYVFNAKHRKIIRANLDLCFPEKSEQEKEAITLEIYQNFAFFAIDALKNQNTSKEKVLQKVVCDEEVVNAYVDFTRPIVFTTAHFGNWELLPLFFAAQFKPMSVVGRALDSKAMDKILQKNRHQFDIEIIDKKGGLRKMLACLKQKRPLGILTDQDASDSESLVLDFFGKKVNWVVGASVVAKKTGALLIPTFIFKNEDKNFEIKVFKPMDSKTASIEELTCYQAKCCEEMIKLKPEQYFFFHKRFKRFYNEIYL
ncbi:lauroyl acyltransferase [Campylobacter sp. MIT 99-7217]|uniref:lipid A biosynthesis lauroyl acyltransferase n=1 Tax=Campylobacter sp. MIT 99-7217 TaxID=535091 RepID=UPI001156F224|nr:lipid A biosynthesis lauroyl acyltransferase [Campylobacter sp. MIT 99-7217]TQR33874.1 lauroyl acyltransferase [Campylobacter sp. MIT 99-7217]